jgi:hypothetical protein
MFEYIGPPLNHGSAETAPRASHNGYVYAPR